MARVAAQKTALPHNHPLHRPLKKRQAEACQRIHALWGVWPWELLIPVAMYESSGSTATTPSSSGPYRYELEHPQDWSDNILDTLRKLALSTTLQHAIARIGYHAALLKVNRLSVRLTKAVTTECEVERERTPPNPKAGSGPIVNRRNKKTLLGSAGSPEDSGASPQVSRIVGMSQQQQYIPSQSVPLNARCQTDPKTMVNQLLSPRSSTPPADVVARSPGFRGVCSIGPNTNRAQPPRQQYQYRDSISQHGGSPTGSSHREWPGLTLPNLEEAGWQLGTQSGTRQSALCPTATGLITPLSEDVSSAKHDSIGSNNNPFMFSHPQGGAISPKRQTTDEDEHRKRKTSPTIRDAIASRLDGLAVSDAPTSHTQLSRHHHHQQKAYTEGTLLAKRQKHALLPGLVQLPAPRVELTPPTSPTSPPTLSSLLLPAIHASSASSSSACSPPPSATLPTPNASCSSFSSSPGSYPAHTASAEVIATLQRANSFESRNSQSQQDHEHPVITRHQLPPMKSQPSTPATAFSPDSSMRLPPILPSSAHQRHRSYDCPASTQQHKISASAAPASSQAQPPQSLTRPSLPGRSVSSYASTSTPLLSLSWKDNFAAQAQHSSKDDSSSLSPKSRLLDSTKPLGSPPADSRMKMSFLM